MVDIKKLQKWRIPISLLIIAVFTTVFILLSYNVYQNYQPYSPEGEEFFGFLYRRLPQGLGVTLAVVLMFNLGVKAHIDLRHLIMPSARKKYRIVFVFFILIFMVTAHNPKASYVYVISNLILAVLYFFIQPLMKKRLMASA